MDWIHCNNCFSQLESGITLQLTSCGHMFCNNCLNNGEGEDTCLICRVPCSMMKLVPDMDQEIQDYFTDPEELIKKCSEVLKFQKQHRRRILSYLLQSTKKFYKTRRELKRMTELCQHQHKQLKEYQKVIRSLESQLEQTKQASPFHAPISPATNMSPGFIHTPPTYKRTSKSTPYSQQYLSNLVTPTRITKNRSSYNPPIQRTNTSNRISSTVCTPPTPESGSFHSVESGYSSSSPWIEKSSRLYCDGFSKKCTFKYI